MVLFILIIFALFLGAFLAIRSHRKTKKEFDNLMVLFEENRKVANQLIRRLSQFNTSALHNRNN